MATLRRNSRQRMLVYDAVKASHEHPNAEEVYQVVKQRLPDISLGTVYRNLKQLAEEGLIKSVGVVDGQERFDARISPHSHFVCNQCGAVLDLPNCVSEETIVPFGQEYGFVVQSYEVHIYGTCRECSHSQAV